MGEHNLFINLFFHDLFFLLCISVPFLLFVWRKHQKAALPRIHLEEGLWHFRQVTQFILIPMRRLLIQAYISSFYRLTPDFIAERLGHANFSELRELDLPHCSLRTVDLGTKDVFINLRRLVSPRHPSSSPPHPNPFQHLSLQRPEPTVNHCVCVSGAFLSRVEKTRKGTYSTSFPDISPHATKGKSPAK